MFQRNEWSKWTTEIIVDGPIKIDKSISFLSRKDVEHGGRLMSNIKIGNSPNGIKLEVDSFAFELKYAKEAAYLFSGLALDVLSLHLNLPLYVELYELKNRVNYNLYGVKRTVDESEWKEAFDEARLLTFTEPTFLRAIGWFRKGKLTQDPSDKFLAFWNSIEVVATKYHSNSEKAKKGTKNKINQCFRDLWGEPNKWKVINGEEWIDENGKIRTDVAHGLIKIDVKSLNEIRDRIHLIEELAYVFLNDWRTEKLNPEEKVTEEIQDKVYDRNWIKMK